MILRTKIAVLVAAAVMISGGMAYQLTRPLDADSNGSQEHNPPDIPPANPTDIAGMVNASNQFALDMYTEIKNDGDNVFFSPYSIFTALGMTYEGARNKTADEIRAVFHFPADKQTRWSLFKALIEKMNSGNSGCNLSTANAMWIEKDFDILSDYVNTVQTFYKAEANNVDFRHAAEAARQRINSWVENQTNGRIKDLIPQGAIDDMTRLVLTNAIYFKGDWEKQFNTSLTKDSDFNTGSGKTVKVKMMARKDDLSVFNYTKSDGVQILDLPYSGEELSMLVLLPEDGAMGSLENMLTLQKISEWRAKLDEQRVDVYFPGFKLETKYSLARDLSAMGMPTAFTGPADFSGMDGEQDLFISSVIHQAYVSVDEKGTEAAAATAVVVAISAIMEPTYPTFNADHPFIFLIQDRATGTILFMGRVSDPTAG